MQSRMIASQICNPLRKPHLPHGPRSSLLKGHVGPILEPMLKRVFLHALRLFVSVIFVSSLVNLYLLWCSPAIAAILGGVSSMTPIAMPMRNHETNPQTNNFFT